jgi:hypothetical protein
MPKGTQVRLEVVQEVKRLSMMGAGKAQIYRYLEENRDSKGRPYLDAEGLPSKSTIDRLVDRHRPADPSGSWSFADASDADPDKARLVLDVVVAIFRASEGRVWLTNTLADWVARIRTVSPAMPPGMAYALAFSYRSLRAQNKDTRCLDIVLASKFWERRGIVNLWEITGRDCHRLGQSEQWLDFTVEMGVALEVPPESNMTPEQIDTELIGIPRSRFYEALEKHIDREAKGESVTPNI